jgi:DNA replication protein DnaC
MTESPADATLDQRLDYLQLPYLKAHCRLLATEAAAHHWTHLDYLGRLVEGEAAARQDRALARRIKDARFPVLKTLESFRWDWPKKINRLQVQNLFRLQFVEEKANVIFLGLVGLGKTHLATALSLRRLSGRPSGVVRQCHRCHQLYFPRHNGHAIFGFLSCLWGLS